MLRKTTVLGALTLLAAGLVPVAAPAPADAAPRDEDRYVDLSAVDPDRPKSFKDVQPDRVTTTPGGQRIEVYGSVGNLEGGMDWRNVNLFAYLVNSVPTGAESYTTLFNSLYDGRTVGYDAVQGRWTVERPDQVFAPTAAFLNQANRYDDEAERLEHIHVLGAKRSLDAAYHNDSSLARLVRAGYRSSRPKAVDYQQCSGAGGCLAFTSGTNLMHSKYAAFEKAADSTGRIRDHVVFITSSNLNGSSGSKKSNTSIVIYDDETAYEAVRDDIYGSKANVADGASPSRALTDGYRSALTVDPATGVIRGIPTDSGITLLPSPRATGSISGNDAATARTDVEAAFLLDQAGDGTTKEGCRVYSVHSLFNSSRGGVQSGLAQLARQQCDVRIVLGTNALSDIVDGYFRMSTDLRQVIDRVEFANVHDKTLTYRHGGTAAAFGGSTNLNGTALEYDELAFRADDVAVTEGIQDHSERLYQRARGRTTWTSPSSVSISPAGSAAKPLSVAPGDRLQVSTRTKPANALVTGTAWTSDDGSVASVDQQGRVTGLAPGSTTIRATVESPGASGTVERTAVAHVSVSATATTSKGSSQHVTAPPTLTMERYQAPANARTAAGTTDIVVTWGSGEQDYSGVVKLQYWSGGWKTYGNWVMVDEDGVGRLTVPFKNSKTWRAYGARLDGIHEDGRRVGGGSTAKTRSTGHSITTVRTKSPSATPRLYATKMAASGGTVPMMVSWKKSGGTFRLQYKSGRKWKTHSTYRIPKGGSQILFANRIRTTKHWRVATSTGPLRISPTTKVSMR